jgi:ornithine decarboxylase
MQKIAADLIRQHCLFDSFYIANMNIITQKIQEWRTYLPNIRPHYAIKCNPNKNMLKLMIKENLGFDCASQQEIETVLKLGAKPENLIYAHPVKAISDLKYAVTAGVKYTTFDSFSELQKLKIHAPDMKCVIRLKVDNPSARVQLGLKYGVEKNEYKDLIKMAKNLNLDIIGTSIHVGSASKDPNVFEEGIDYCNEVLGYARQNGFFPNLLDIGGGFTKDNFKDCAKVINTSIQKYDLSNMRIIAEPGRYFAEEFMTFFVNITGQRKRNNINEYWISDGLYGSFNCIIYDGQTPTFEVLRHPLLEKYKGEDKLLNSKINACTCDSLDIIGDKLLPYLRNNDYLMIPAFGAYTIAGATNFNGINMMNPKIFYINTKFNYSEDSSSQITQYFG